MNKPSKACLLLGVLSGIAQLTSLIIFGVTNTGIEVQQTAIYLPYMPIMFLVNFLIIRNNEVSLFPAISGAAIFWCLNTISILGIGNADYQGAYNLFSGVGRYLSFSLPAVLGQYLGYLAGNKARTKRILQ